VSFFDTHTETASSLYLSVPSKIRQDGDFAKNFRASPFNKEPSDDTIFSLWLDYEKTIS
jgi:hypothetical protein